jgi:hypothetical protein
MIRLKRFAKKGYLVYLNANQEPCQGDDKPMLKKMVKGTGRASFFLALIRRVTSPKVSYHPAKDSIKSFNEW